MNIEEMSKEELVVLSKAVEEEITKREVEHRKEAIETIKEVAESYGFKISDLFGPRKQNMPKKKAEPKYADPKNPDNTWTGRGRHPTWFKQAIQDGLTPADMEI